MGEDLSWEGPMGSCSVTRIFFKSTSIGTSLVAQWIRLHVPNAGGPGLILVRELDPTCMLQLRVCMPQLRSPRAATKELASHN